VVFSSVASAKNPNSNNNEPHCLIREYIKQKVDSCGFLNNNTIFCLSYTDETRFSYWSYDLDSGKRTLIFEDESFFYPRQGGIQFLWRKYALDIYGYGGTILVDLVTGERTGIEDFQYTRDTIALLNPAETRILFTKHDFQNDDLGITDIGVYNLQTEEISILTRQGYENRAEVSLGWFDNERVEVRAMNESGEYYLYL
jgi:Tol biopolymer transport system component